MTKRLFIFAGFDGNNIVDETLLYYLRALSGLGDIVFYMDNNLTVSEIGKIGKIPNVLHAAATRHGEYDFGSYKRGYQWAADNNILENYDWVYLVNDSVYGPLRDLRPILEDLENRGADAVGMYFAQRKSLNHLQSWFVGLVKSVAQSDWFASFMMNISAQESRDLVVLHYEYGMSQLLAQHGCKFTSFDMGLERNDVMRNPMGTLRRGMPFIKKNPFALGNIKAEKYIREYIPATLIEPIRSNMSRRGVIFSKYKKLWDFRLFGIIPILKLEQEVFGGAGVKRLMLFKKIKLADIRY